MLSKRTLLLATYLLFSRALSAQEACPAKFGKVTPEDFKTTTYQIDTSAAAVIIADVGSSEFDTDNDWFIQVFKCYKRVHILKKTAYDLADQNIYLYVSGTNEERVVNLKAATYNLVNGKVVETKLDPKAVFTEKLDKNNTLKKFTLPNVQEGSIIEYTYTIKSEFPYRLRPWAFQGGYPMLWSEYEVELPEYYEYIFLSQGYNPFYIKSSKNVHRTYSIRVSQDGAYGGSVNSQNLSLTPGVTRHRWVMKDIVPLKEESYVTTLRNHVSAIEFQLSTVRYPNSPPKPVNSSWTKCMEELLKDEEYAGTLNKGNHFLSSKLDELTKNAANEEELARRIFNYVRDNYTCTDHSAIYTSQSLRTTFNKKSGTVAEVNLLLVAMLRQAGLNATPVLLSTREHGKVYPIYPLLSRFNYTIAHLSLNGNYYQLDATQPYLGFNRLPEYCYNGHARLVNESADALEGLDADSLKEVEITGIFIRPGENGKLSGHYQQRSTYFSSSNVRKKVKDKGKDEFFKSLEKGFKSPIKLQNGVLDSLDNYDNPVTIEYDFDLELPDENGLIYLNPMFSEGLSTNPFKSADRRYPVEMSFVPDYIYTLSFILPEGYEVEDLPESIVVKYNENEGFFQFVVAKQDHMLQMRSRLKLGRAVYSPEEYADLRSFFDVVVKKHAEQIVLKKKSS